MLSHKSRRRGTTGVDHDTRISAVDAGTGAADATALLDLDGLAVQAVEQTVDGHLRVWLARSDAPAGTERRRWSGGV